MAWTQIPGTKMTWTLWQKIAYGTCFILQVAFIVLLVRSCGVSSSTSTVDQDSVFVPAVREQYRPASLPFEPERKTPGNLPSRVIKKSRSVLQIVKRIPVDSLRVIIDTTLVVLGDDLRMRVVADPPDSADVREYEILQPWISFGNEVSVGVALSDGLRPSVSYSPMKIAGTIVLPVFGLDPTGVSIGLGYTRRELIIGLSYHLAFEDGVRRPTISVHYIL